MNHVKEIKLEIQKTMAIIFQAVPTILLILLTSSCLAARQLEYKGGPSPAPAVTYTRSDNSVVQDRCHESENKTDSRSLCTRAACHALQALDNINQALMDLENGPEARSMFQLTEDCGKGLTFAYKMIRQAIKEGPKPPVHEYYDYTSFTFTFALFLLHSCDVDANAAPNLHQLGESYNLFHSLIINAEGICYPSDGYS